MSKKIEFNVCFECPDCCWYDDLKSFVCSLNNRKVIYGIETIQSWCPLSNALRSKFLKIQEKYVSFYF
ncbi:MAG: hypothetical protein ACFFE4_19985 [Candidatus Thorarchaeota archaeon]